MQSLSNASSYVYILDEIDAAARICDPIFTGVRIDLDKHEDESKKCKPHCKDYGKFLKDYRETEW